MKKNSGLIITIVVIGITSFTTCSASGGAKRANFGKYPADYEIAYISLYNFLYKLPNPLTVRDLFGPNAHFVTSLSGYPDIPVVITLEEAKGTQRSFTAQLLLSTKTSEGTKKGARLQVTFESDSISEKSYMRYVKLTDMTNGKITEHRGYGDEKTDAGTLALFAGFWSEGLFWDVSKYK
jgi:hypothetical protein